MPVAAARTTDTDNSDTIGADAFAALMDRLAPFEHRPRLAVAVSGGRDSMALALLAADWAYARRGAVTALTVDHGLRAGSADEAARVSRWMAARDIPHEILAIPALDPDRAVEAGARAARYGALEAWCRARGVLHLLVGHHRADQAETQAMRAARGSGPAGRAGMAAIRELAGVRVLRPLLEVPRARLTSTLQARGQAWIEDPSNHDPRFERARLRGEGAGRREDIDTRPLAAARSDHERAIAALAGHALRVDPAGFATLAPAALIAAPAGIARDLLGRVVTTVGGGVYPPRGARLDSLWDLVRSDPGRVRRTLAGCVIAGGPGDVLIVRREHAAVAGAVPATRGHIRWDERFDIMLRDTGRANAQVDSLGRASRDDVVRLAPKLVRAVPADVRWALPALYSGGNLIAGPDSAGDSGIAVRFAPRMPVAGAVFSGF